MYKKNRLPNFAELKKRISFTDILNHYSLTEGMRQQTATQLRGICPIHKGSNNNSFSISTEKNCFNCFSCKAQGDIIDFVVYMEDCKSKYQAGLLLEKWFSVSTNAKRSERPIKRVQEKEPGKTTDADINPPLTFTLKNLEYGHPYLLSRVVPDTIKTFGLGVCSKGMMKGRLVVPIHNAKGELVAYAGRAIDKATEEAEGKYKFPPNFKKGHVLFNFWRFAKGLKNSESLILVEGFFDVFRLIELGYSNVVALMGAVMTEEQEALLKISGVSDVVLLFDNDEAGQACTQDVLARLSKWCNVKIAKLPQGVRQPDELKEKIII